MCDFSRCLYRVGGAVTNCFPFADMVMITPQTASPRPRRLQRKGGEYVELERNSASRTVNYKLVNSSLFADSTPVSSPRNGTKKDSTDYLRLARKGGGHPGEGRTV